MIFFAMHSWSFPDLVEPEALARWSGTTGLRSDPQAAGRRYDATAHISRVAFRRSAAGNAETTAERVASNCRGEGSHATFGFRTKLGARLCSRD